MDLLPTPDQVFSAAGNVARKVLHGGVADLRRMPRTRIDEGPSRQVFAYRPASSRPSGDPVLLVAPLAAPAICYDLRRGCSLVEHLVGTGRPTYLVEYGEVPLAERGLGLDPWVDDVVPRAVEAVVAHAGGRPVQLVGWSFGGVMALLAAAGHPELPIASVALLGTPVDIREVPLTVPSSPRVELGLIGPMLRILEGIPSPVVRTATRLAAASPLTLPVVTRPVAALQHLDDAEWLAQTEAVEEFGRRTTAYRGRGFSRLFHRILPGDQLLEGVWRREGEAEPIRLADLTAPVLVVAGNTDAITPLAAIRPLTGLLPNAAEVRLEIVPGGHLGLLTGRRARETTWPTLDEWFAAHRRRPRAGGTAADASPRDTIGSNPKRRYGSAGSRGLGRR